MSAAPDARLTPSSGNVFADLGLPEPDVLLAKAELARQIAAALDQRCMACASGAALLGIEVTDLKALLEGHFTDFHVDTLAHYLTVLGKDVQIVVSEKPAAATSGRLSVVTV